MVSQLHVSHDVLKRSSFHKRKRKKARKKIIVFKATKGTNNKRKETEIIKNRKPKLKMKLH